MHPVVALTSVSAPSIPTASARLIFRRAQARIDHLLLTSLPFDTRIECAWDVVLQAARDLDRLAAKRDRSDVLTVRSAAIRETVDKRTRSLTMREALDRFHAAQLLAGRR